MKIAISFNFYPLKEFFRDIKKGKLFPKHHLWGYDFLEEKYELMQPHVFHKKCNIVQELLFGVNYPQEKKIACSSKHDLLYSPFLFDCYYLAFLRMLGLYHKPIIAIAQDTWRMEYCNTLKRKIFFLYQRFVAKHGVDKLLFISENVYNKCNDYFDSDRQTFLKHWGIDLSYFDSYIQASKKGNGQYVYLTGGSNRDFNLAYEAAKRDGEYQLFVQTNKIDNKLKEKFSNLPNVLLDFECKGEADLLDGYNNASIVLVPLVKDTGSMTGITVVFEAMAMSKPIISTRSEYYPLDLEKEGCGIYVNEGDIDGLNRAIKTLLQNPEKMREMGNKGRKIVEERFNYSLFCSELYGYIKQFEQ
ncbi:MAG: glycosyltransferase family 4 protein [Prevotella sp.]